MNPKSRRLKLTPEEEAKVARMKQRAEGVKVDSEWLFIAEFGYYYGWEGVQAILKNEISFAEANMLLQGAIKVWYGKLVQMGRVTYTANAASQSKNGHLKLEKGLKEFSTKMKADIT